VTLTGSSGNDNFWAYPDYSFLSGSTSGQSYFYRANGFEKVIGLAAGGNDTARLYGQDVVSPNPVDTFVAGALTAAGSTSPVVRALMSDGTYQNSGADITTAGFQAGTASYTTEAYGFHTVIGESRDAGEAAKNDVARILDYASGADTFTGSLSTGTGTMTGSGGYAITAKKFQTFDVHGDKTNDTAKLVDSSAVLALKDAALADWLEVGVNVAGDSQRARLFNVKDPSKINTVFQVSDFQNVRAQVADTAQKRVNRRKIDNAPSGWNMAYDPDGSLWAGSGDDWTLPWLQ